MATAGRRAAVALALLLHRGARAQVYRLKDVAMPVDQPYSLEVLYTYYVYSRDDSPKREELAGMPYVKMNAWTNVTGGSFCKTDGSFGGVQLSILPRREFWSLFNPEAFCDTQTEKLTLRSRKGEVGFWPGYTHDVTGGVGEKAELPATGAYYLVLSNCGRCLNQTISGEVELRNTYGFLPANEYYKMAFYGALLVAFVTTVIMWGVQLARWSSQTHAIHHCLTVVVLCAFIEALMERMLLSAWNVTGGYAPWMLCSANLASVMKSGLLYVLVCYIAQGWGVTHESLESVTKTKVELFACFYFPVQYIFEGVLAFRHSHHISETFMLVCWVPSAIMSALVFYWIFVSLIELLETAKRSQQPGLLTMLHRLGKTMTFMAVVTLVALVFKILDISQNEPPASWHGQWVLAEGMQDVAFFIVIALQMFILAPYRSMKEYLYTVNMAVDDPDADVIGAQAPAVWAEEDGGDILDDDKDDGDAFWTMTHPKGKGAGGGGDRREPSPESRVPKTGTADHDLLG